jgi:hypothetical protein
LRFWAGPVFVPESNADPKHWQKYAVGGGSWAGI